jgi:hypothetical protein
MTKAQLARAPGTGGTTFGLEASQASHFTAIAEVATEYSSRRAVFEYKPEALDFIQTTRFDTAAVEQFANRHGIAKPDIRQSLQHTAMFVNSHCIARGQAL